MSSVPACYVMMMRFTTSVIHSSFSKPHSCCANYCVFATCPGSWTDYDSSWSYCCAWIGICCATCYWVMNGRDRPRCLRCCDGDFATCCDATDDYDRRGRRPTAGGSSSCDFHGTASAGPRRTPGMWRQTARTKSSKRHWRANGRTLIPQRCP